MKVSQRPRNPRREETEESNDDKAKPDELSDRRRHARGSRDVSGNPPNDRPQHPTTVEREPWNHIEDRQAMLITPSQPNMAAHGD